MSNSDYKLQNISVICPDCNLTFGTPCLVQTPAISNKDMVEADLHRVFPDAAIRGSLIAICPECNYANWIQYFEGSNIKAEYLKQAEKIEPAIKFALALKYQRKRIVSPIELGYLALNGLWCAKEAKQDIEPWLELTAYEYRRSYPDEQYYDDGYMHLLMGELYRQLQVFDLAVECYRKISSMSYIPQELIFKQTTKALEKDSSPTMLSAHLIDTLLNSIRVEQEMAAIEKAQPKETVVAAPVEVPAAAALPAVSETITAVAETPAIAEIPAAPVEAPIAVAVAQSNLTTDMPAAAGQPQNVIPGLVIYDESAAKEPVSPEQLAAVAQIESYLSMSQLYGYQSWMKGYRSF